MAVAFSAEGRDRAMGDLGLDGRHGGSARGFFQKIGARRLSGLSYIHGEWNETHPGSGPIMAIGTRGSSLKHLRELFRGGTAVGLSDGELLRRYAASHDGPAFEALVARHGPMVVATCRAVLRDHHDVEDAFQATFLVLARKAASIRAGDALGGWLHRVAYRAAVRLNVEAKRRRRHEAEVIGDAGPRTQPVPRSISTCAPSCTRRSTGCRTRSACRSSSAISRA